MAKKPDGKVGKGAYIPNNAKVPGGCLIASFDMAVIGVIAVAVAKATVARIRTR